MEVVFISIENAFYEKILRPFTVNLIHGLWIKEIKGLENIPENGAAILVANHTSYFDFLIIPSIIKNKQVNIMAAEELVKHPIIGWYVRNDRCILVNRKNPGVSFFKKGLEVLRNGELLLIFPEGSRSPDGKLQSWHRAFVRLALLTKVPIIPIALKGVQKILPKGAKFLSFNKCSVCINSGIDLNKFYGKKLNKEKLLEIANLIKTKVAESL